jgi:sugar lactone lactonase YvrE
MVTLLGALAMAAAAQAQAQNPAHKLTKLWETKAVLKVPESVRFDSKRRVLYVSNIDGEPWAVDGKGSIAKVGLDGKVIDAQWVQGLDCPKGMALSDDAKQLYVADAGGVVTIDIESGKIVGKVPIPDGQQLNDLVNDGKGTLYVSDSKGRKVFAVREAKASLYLDDTVLKGPNGLLVHDDALYVLDNNSLNRVEPDKTLKVIADGMPGGTDGLEHVRGGDFLVSVWSGAIWYVKSDGAKELLFDGKVANTSTADIGWDPSTMMVYVPTFGKNTVIAFKVE